MSKSMNAGKLRAFCEVLQYSENDWKPMYTAYSAYKRQQRVIYSRHAAAAPGAQFLMRETGIDRHMAIRYDGKLHLVTEIEPVERGFITVTAAEVYPVRLMGFRKEITQGTLNRPITTDERITPFWGVIAEKYVRAEQEAPQSEITTALILTTPKSVVLKPGDRLTSKGTEYDCHFDPDNREGAWDMRNTDMDYRVTYSYANTDKYRNDYEIVREDEA